MNKKDTRFDRPIFLIGHARAGSTLIGSILAMHPEIGPTPEAVSQCESVQELLDLTKKQELHYELAVELEQKDVWFQYFPGQNVFATMGRGCIVEDSRSLSADQTKSLIDGLAKNLREPRFLSKAPTNSFRIKLILELFPDARFIVLYRDGVDVVSSYLNWKRRPYYRELGMLRGTWLVARSWNQTFHYVEANRPESACVVSYNEFLAAPQKTMKRIFQFLELDPPSLIYDLPEFSIARKRKLPFYAYWFARLLTYSGSRVCQDITRKNLNGYGFHTE